MMGCSEELSPGLFKLRGRLDHSTFPDSHACELEAKMLALLRFESATLDLLDFSKVSLNKTLDFSIWLLASTFLYHFVPL